MKRGEFFLIVIALLSAGAYLSFAAARGAIGFPLDDAWIHQVYARHLATRGEFAFFSGQPSAGSTSPLWAILLALGYLLHIDFRAWAYLLGALSLGTSAIAAARLSASIFPQFPRASLVVAGFLLFEWHMAWSAVSGMEIPPFIFLSLLLLERFYARAHAFLLGLIAALLMLTRPEGVVLAALVGVGIVTGSIEARREGRRKLDFSVREIDVLAVVRRVLLYWVGFGILITPYLVFNFAASGTILPNTFYAKNAEYAILLERAPFLVRWLQLSAQPWIGAQILLFPGFLFILARFVMKRDWRMLVPFAWILLLPALYALRLPVTFQYGRYEMPIIPFIALYGILGTTELFERIKSFVLRATWTISTAATLIAFWLLRANAYASDVAIIDCEMVQTARWVAANVPADALVAAHDIGALGYFYERPFIDLAGLVTPEVIPFMRDEGRLRDYLFSRHATFAVFFPDWSDAYAALASDPRLVPVHQQDCPVARAAGGTDMVVYQIR